MLNLLDKIWREITDMNPKPIFRETGEWEIAGAQYNLDDFVLAIREEGEWDVFLLGIETSSKGGQAVPVGWKSKTFESVDVRYMGSFELDLTSQRFQRILQEKASHLHQRNPVLRQRVRGERGFKQFVSNPV